MRTLFLVVASVLTGSAAQAQTWDVLQAVPKESTVRVHEAGGKGWAFVDGKLLLVKDSELAILRSGRPITIPKASIARVERRRRDLPIEGALLGALLGSAACGQGCSRPGFTFTVSAMTAYAVIGGFIDWRMVRGRAVYRAP